MKRFELTDYRPSGLRVLPVGAVFVDLDETLVYSVERPKSRRDQIRLTDEDGKVKVISSLLRPGAREFLAGLRSVAPAVRMLTNGAADYAHAINQLYALGFAETDIIARENYTFIVNKVERPMAVTVFPGSVLIDNEVPTMQRASVKRAFLGPSLYIQIRTFDGRPDPFPVLDEVLSAVRLALRATT